MRKVKFLCRLGVVVVILVVTTSTMATLTPWSESFESGYPDWDSTTNKAYYQIIDTDATDGTHCLRYAPYNGKELHRSIGSSNAFEVSWDYKGDETGGTYDLNWLQLRNAAGEARVLFYQRRNISGSGIELGFWGGGVSVTAAADTWVHNKLVVEGETVSWYFEGNLIGSTALVGTSGTASTEIYLSNGGTLSEGYIDAMTVAVPEPATMLLLGAGGILALRRRRSLN